MARHKSSPEHCFRTKFALAVASSSFNSKFSGSVKGTSIHELAMTACGKGRPIIRAARLIDTALPRSRYIASAFICSARLLSTQSKLQDRGEGAGVNHYVRVETNAKISLNNPSNDRSSNFQPLPSPSTPLRVICQAECSLDDGCQSISMYRQTDHQQCSRAPQFQQSLISHRVAI